MNKYLAFLCLLAALQSRSQDLIRTCTQNSSVRLAAIHPDSTDYTDLAPIGRAIGNARVVMLGEQDHGDAPTFLAKTRLIKYLHEKLGFNILAFESDFFSLNHAQFGDNPDSFFKASIFPIWTYCKACTPLFHDYLPAARQSASPLLLAGFDCQMSLTQLLPGLDSTLRRLQLPLTLAPDYSQCLPLLWRGAMNLKDTALSRRYTTLLATIREQLRQKLPADDFWCMVINNLRVLDLAIKHKSLGPKGFAASMNLRDSQMALNLQWICEKKYPGEKIIVWAHNYHVSKYAGHYKEDYKNSTTSMGSYFTADSLRQRQTYIIGFTSYEGTAGRLSNKTGVYKLARHPANSYENWINASWNYAFTDFRAFTDTHPGHHEPFSMAGGANNSREHQNTDAEWHRIFDGIIFIRKMYSCIGL